MSLVAIALAFTAGLFSFLSPCIVPMLSVYFSLISGQSFRDLRDLSAAEAIRKGVLKSTLGFIAGFTLVFTAAGAAAGQVGSLLERSMGVLNLVGGVFVIVIGLMMVGLLPQDLLQRLTLRHRDMDAAPPGPRVWSSFLVGLFFAVACSHCIAPTLYSVLIYAGTTGSPITGALLMTAFSLGLAIPYLLSGLFLGNTVRLLKGASAPRRWVQWATGVLMIGLGLAMITGKLTWLTAAVGQFWPFKLPMGM